MAAAAGRHAGVYAVLHGVSALAVVHSYRQYRRERAQEPAEALADVCAQRVASS